MKDIKTFGDELIDRMACVLGINELEQREAELVERLVLETPLDRERATAVARMMAPVRELDVDHLISHGTMTGWDQLARIASDMLMLDDFRAAERDAGFLMIGDTIVPQKEWNRLLRETGIDVKVICAETDLAGDRIEIELDSRGGMIPGVLRAEELRGLLPPQPRRPPPEPSYLDHDPTKSFRRRRRR